MKTTQQDSFVSEFGYGGFWKRYLASTIDGMIIGLIAGSISFGFVSTGDKFNFTSFAPSFLISALYPIYFWSKQNGQTLGKRAMGLRVVKEDGSPVDVNTGILRYIGYLVSSIFMLGFVSAAFDRRKQGWHDKIAHTVVVRTDDKRRLFLSAIFIIMPLLFVVLGALAALGIGLALKNSDTFKNQIIPEIKKEIKDVLPIQTELELDDLNQEVFNRLNEVRQAAKLKPFVVDQKLCAYSQRRLSQINEFGKYDDSKGFYEDMADPQIARSYFTGYNHIGENIFNLEPTTSAIDIATTWSQAKDSAILNKIYTHACVRSLNGFVVLISAEKK